MGSGRSAVTIFINCGGAGEKLQVLMAPIRGLPCQVEVEAHATICTRPMHYFRLSIFITFLAHPKAMWFKCLTQGHKVTWPVMGFFEPTTLGSCVECFNYSATATTHIFIRLWLVENFKNGGKFKMSIYGQIKYISQNMADRHPVTIEDLEQIT
jgi:hypothetical protein